MARTVERYSCGSPAWGRLAAVVLCVAGAGAIGDRVWLHEHVTPVAATRSLVASMTTADGEQLTSFFDGVATVPSSRALKPTAAEQCNTGLVGRLSSRVQHFLGLGKVVYAFDGCDNEGCNEQSDPNPQDCGCGMRVFTDSVPNQTNNGVTPTPMCIDCSTSNGGIICKDNQCPPIIT